MLMNNNEYIEIIESIKNEIKSAQYKATVSVNREHIMLYYNIGKVSDEGSIWRKALLALYLPQKRLREIPKY